eukprot:7153537-Alexandrium_andersonii.AAC.1
MQKVAGGGGPWPPKASDTWAIISNDPVGHGLDAQFVACVQQGVVSRPALVLRCRAAAKHRQGVRGTR